MLGTARAGTKMADVQEFRESWSHKEERRKRLGERLVQAGLYKRNSMFFFYTTQGLLGGVPILIGFAAATMGFATLPIALVLGAMTGVGGNHRSRLLAGLTEAHGGKRPCAARCPMHWICW